MWNYEMPYAVIEGMDRAGKSSIIKAMQPLLQHPYQIFREPGGTSFGETIRSLVLEQQTDNTRLTATEEMALMLTQRSYLHRHAMRPALESGKLIIADRGEASTYVYQVNHTNDDAFLALRESMNIMMPDVFFYIDVDYETYLHRKRGHGVEHQYHDVMDKSVFQDRRKRYREYMERFLPAGSALVFNANENRTIEEMATIIATTLNNGIKTK